MNLQINVMKIMVHTGIKKIFSYVSRVSVCEVYDLSHCTTQSNNAYVILSQHLTIMCQFYAQS